MAKQYVCDECGKTYTVSLYTVRGAFQTKGGILIPENEKDFCNRACFFRWIKENFQYQLAHIDLTE